jgi:hypothetical protein
MRSNTKVCTFLFLVFLFLPFVTGCAHAGTAVGASKVYVDPEQVKVNVGEAFDVRINVSDVSYLQGLDFMLKYSVSILNCLIVQEGNFMKSFGDTFVAKQEINNSFSSGFGRVWLAVAILGKGYANGSGTLATIRFNATAAGESVLDLYSDYPYRPNEVKLTTCGSEVISNIAVDGQVIVTSDGANSTVGNPSDPVDPPSPDVNGDGLINIVDIALIAPACGTSAGDKRYSVRLDLDQNGLIDIRDVSICVREFGKRIE